MNDYLVWVDTAAGWQVADRGDERYCVDIALEYTSIGLHSTISKVDEAGEEALACVTCSGLGCPDCIDEDGGEDR